MLKHCLPVKNFPKTFKRKHVLFLKLLSNKSCEVQEELKSQYETTLEEEVSLIKEELTDRVDAYLEYVAKSGLQRINSQLKQGLKAEMTESFLTGMKVFLKIIM